MPARGERTSDMLCKFYDRGKCVNDINCRFRHGPSDRRPLVGAAAAGAAGAAPPASIKVSCRYHAQGRCSNGSACPYSHSSYEADEAVRRRQVQQQQQQLQARARQSAMPQQRPLFGSRSEDQSVAEATAQISKLTVLGKSEAKEQETHQEKDSGRNGEVEWEFPSDEDAYFYGAAGTFAPQQQQQQQGAGPGGGSAWSAVAVTNVPDNVLAAAAQAEELSKAAFEESLAAAAKNNGAAAAPPPREVCQFFLSGTCRYGVACRNAHSAAAAAAADDDTALEAEERERSARAECGICYDPVQGRFGVLTGCDHAFCLECIRNWRAVGVREQAAVRACPLCRAPSHFIVPSARLVAHPARKAALVERYKETLARIPCRHFASGDCPFGGSCFYAHLAADGSRAAPPQLRMRAGADGETEVHGDVQLSSFIAHSGRLPA
ncbi:hypothetical protein JKP88DRAFT_262539 [Tribonema minus]|uniref:RING-type E3 ubiquitin transferase n=1 Tax=Tribonema minus TaxID=303371 RepID=A0A835Z5J0_9STRA|nr:hypothetical protein JKP88DRAFT_262539 [Tribonema minus]